MPCICEQQGFDTYAAGLFGECVYGTRQSIAFALGWISSFFFFCCEYPQLRLNILLRKSEGLSIFLLLCWCCNDICNMSSIFLLKQLFTQKLTGSIWAFFDILVLSSHIFFNYQKHFQFVSRCTDFGKTEVLLYIFVLTFVAVNLLWAGFYNQNLIVESPEQFDLCPKQEIVHIDTPAGLAGTIFIYTSIIFNLGSRFPQLYRNWRRKTAEGVSYGLFFCSGMGNLLLMFNIVLWQLDSEYQVSKIPYTISIGGAWILDFSIIIQKVYYVRLGYQLINQDSKVGSEIDGSYQ